MDFDETRIKELIKTSYSYDELCKKYFGYSKGKNLTMIRNFVNNRSLDVRHFDIKHNKRKYEIIEKICPVCGKIFTAKKGHIKEKITCSYSCSNSLFRSGENNGNWDNDVYRTTCFKHHDKKCIICGEENIVAVHHYDCNHENNSPDNLVPLCPTHHQYMHSNFAPLIIDKIRKYVEDFKNKIKK